ncbi:hypothetical protein GCM10023116_48420 [Kistimonas scapharcae]|uniref:Uncharacterized protein n=1 Tax=Kistimonas scapharcae TaxID=1036133 RepID=A0ABP8V8I8_9GAMM
MFTPRCTSDESVTGASKCLLVAHHGWGKTYTYRHYQRHFGPGFIISGESGLKSIQDCDIDYLPFTSWDGRHDPGKGVYSFRGIIRMMHTPEFAAMGYQWVGIDSLTEMSDRLWEFLEKKHEGNKNKFDIWADFARLLIGSLKYVRDMPTHVLVTCLAAEEMDDNGQVHYWPFVKGQKVGKQVPGLFDFVFCGIRKTEGDGENLKVVRKVITDEVKGWHGKARDPKRRLKPVEDCDDITQLFTRMDRDGAAFETHPQTQS